MNTKKAKPPLVTEEEVWKHFLEEGTKIFGKVTKKDKELYGKVHGKDDLLAYGRYIDSEFTTPCHIEKIAEKLTDVENGKIKYLIINMPPQNGKSTLCTKIFPTWYLGKNPKKNVIVASYNDDFAKKFSGNARDVCESDRFKVIFEKFEVNRQNRSKKNWRTTAGGGMRGAGIGGTITGNPADLIIIDDPTKDYKGSISKTIQDGIWEWYRSVITTRLTPKTAIVLVMTRWVSFDLAGRLIEERGLIENGGAWDVLRLPALDTKGAPLWPEKYPQEFLYNIRSGVGERLWSAMYQQEPIDISERLFGDPKFEEPSTNIKKMCYLDPAFGGKDYSAFCIGGLAADGDNQILYITHGEVWQSQIEKTYDKVERIWKSANAGTITVEVNQAQKAVAAEFRRRGIPIKEVTNTTNKHLRIVNFVKINWDNIRFSKNVSDKFLSQLLDYSELAEHDDAADSLAGLVNSMNFGRGRLENRFDGFLNLLGW